MRIHADHGVIIRMAAQMHLQLSDVLFQWLLVPQRGLLFMLEPRV